MSEPEKPRKIVPEGQTKQVPDKGKPNDQLSDDDADGAAGGGTTNWTQLNWETIKN
jgi:hypothetical protein